MKGLLLAALAAVTILRVLLVLQDGNVGRDSYLVMCGARPDIAYFDGPGGVPVLAAVGMIAGGDAALAWPLLALAATFALLFAARPLVGSPAAVFAAVLLNLLPAFNEAALRPGPGMPLLVLGLVFLGAAWRGLAGGIAAWWLVAGLSAAGGLVFSYAASLLPLSLLLVVAASHRWRPIVRRPAFWLALIPCLVPLALLLRWNADHGWVHFIGGTWQTATSLDPALLPSTFRHAAAAASPVALLAMLIAAGQAFAILPSAPKVKFVLVPALLFLAATLQHLLTGGAQAAIGLLTLCLPLLLLGLVPPKVGRLTPRLALSLVLVFTAVWSAFSLAAHSRPVPLAGPGVVREIENLKAGLGPVAGSPLLLVAEDAALASAMAVQLQDRSHAQPGHPAVYVVESPAEASQFALWPRYDQFLPAPAVPAAQADDPFTEQDGVNPFLGASALFVTTQREDDLPQAITAAFGGLRLLAEITTPSGAILRIFLCSDYQTLPL